MKLRDIHAFKFVFTAKLYGPNMLKELSKECSRQVSVASHQLKSSLDPLLGHLAFFQSHYESVKEDFARDNPFLEDISSTSDVQVFSRLRDDLHFIDQNKRKQLSGWTIEQSSLTSLCQDLKSEQEGQLSIGEKRRRLKNRSLNVK